MDKLELQRLRDLPIEGVAERLGLRVSRGHKSLCPFHDDHHASLSYSLRNNTCRCFVCMDESMGTIDLVMKHLRLSFPEACRWLADSHNVILSEWRPATPCVAVHKPSFDASRYERFFQRPWLSDEARRFLFDERKLDPRVVRWCRLTSWRDRNGVNWLQTPYYDMDGKLIGVQHRNLDYHSPSLDAHRSTLDSTPRLTVGHTPPLSAPPPSLDAHRSSLNAQNAPRFRFPYGSQCGIYNLPVLRMLKPGEDLWITEGCSDCWAMLSAGHKAIAIPSATLLSPKDKEILSSLDSTPRLTVGHTPPLNAPLSSLDAHRSSLNAPPSSLDAHRSTLNAQPSSLDAHRSSLNAQNAPHFHMYPDKDAPGERLFLQLKELLPELQHHQLPPGCKDFSDYYVREHS